MLLTLNNPPDAVNRRRGEHQPVAAQFEPCSRIVLRSLDSVDVLQTRRDDG